MKAHYIKTKIEWFFGLFVPKRITYANISYLAPNNRLRGKKIVVTGGGSGLGYSMAKKFIDEGAQVLISGRREEIIKRAYLELGCELVRFDVSNIVGIETFIKEASQKLDGIDCIVNNAGISLHEGDIRNVTEEGFDNQYSINLKGGYFLSQSFIKYFENNRRKNGSILFVSSERGQYVDDIPYGLIKSSIKSLTQCLGKTLIKSDIRVNAIAPGVTVSEMTSRSRDNLYCAGYATERVYLPEEVAEIACFLLSDASSCLSGQIFVCNNGYSSNTYK